MREKGLVKKFQKLLVNFGNFKFEVKTRVSYTGGHFIEEKHGGTSEGLLKSVASEAREQFLALQ